MNRGNEASQIRREMNVRVGREQHTERDQQCTRYPLEPRTHPAQTFGESRRRRDTERSHEKRADTGAPARSERDADEVRPRDARDRGQLWNEPSFASEYATRHAE